MRGLALDGARQAEWQTRLAQCAARRPDMSCTRYDHSTSSDGGLLCIKPLLPVVGCMCACFNDTCKFNRIHSDPVSRARTGVGQ